MLLSLKKLHGFRVLATDGHIGWVNDFLFDDESWSIQYLMVDTGMWISRRKAIPIPFVLGEAESQTNSLYVDLSKEKIRKSPDIDLKTPITRQKELEIHSFYGWTPYWIRGGNHGMNVISQKQTSPEMKKRNTNLRRTKEVAGGRILGTDGEIGQAEDFIIDDSIWAIRCIVVETRNECQGKQVLLSPDWIKKVDWVKPKILVDLTEELIVNSPKYDHSVLLNQNYEQGSRII
jgi:uncharacterized protein YrrD